MKRTLMLMLCVALVVTMFSTVAFAKDEIIAENFNGATLGDTAKSGKHYNYWRVERFEGKDAKLQAIIVERSGNDKAIKIDMSCSGSDVPTNQNGVFMSIRPENAKGTKFEEYGFGELSFDFYTNELLYDGYSIVNNPANINSTAFNKNEGILQVKNGFWYEKSNGTISNTAQWGGGSSVGDSWLRLGDDEIYVCNQIVSLPTKMTINEWHTMKIKINQDNLCTVTIDDEVVFNKTVSMKHDGDDNAKFRGFYNPQVAMKRRTDVRAQVDSNGEYYIDSYLILDNPAIRNYDFAYAVKGISDTAYTDGALQPGEAIEYVELEQINPTVGEVTVVVGLYKNGVLESASLATGALEDGAINFDVIEVPEDVEGYEVRIMVLSDADTITPIATSVVY